jgi:hypothetical protein
VPDEQIFVDDLEDVVEALPRRIEIVELYVAAGLEIAGLLREVQLFE